MIEYNGRLVLIYEQGCEGCGLVGIMDDRGATKNPNYDPKATSGLNTTPEFYSWDWTFTYKKGDHLKVWGPDKALVFDSILEKNRQMMLEANYRVCFIPHGVQFLEWYYWHNAEYRAHLVRA